ncbi:hypothetical protein T484DRAFT_1962995 [Baffinella frigidus]|nr:hypothetical protein T484DRAFT_1962995 [Cryptophyta sp. CCMP2293]
MESSFCTVKWVTPALYLEKIPTLHSTRDIHLSQAQSLDPKPCTLRPSPKPSPLNHKLQTTDHSPTPTNPTPQSLPQTPNPNP